VSPPNPYRNHQMPISSAVSPYIHARGKVKISPPDPADPWNPRRWCVLEERSGISDQERKKRNRWKNPPTHTNTETCFRSKREIPHAPKMCADFMASFLADFASKRGKTPQMPDARVKMSNRPTKLPVGAPTRSTPRKMLLLQNRSVQFFPVLPKSKDNRETTAARLPALLSSKDLSLPNTLRLFSFSAVQSHRLNVCDPESNFSVPYTTIASFTAGSNVFRQRPRR
jgi:hypothetical protein